MTAETAWAATATALAAWAPAGARIELRHAHGPGPSTRVLAPRGRLLDGHVTAGIPRARWIVGAGCGTSVAWALAERTPKDPSRAAAELEPLLLRAAALTEQERASRVAEAMASLLEHLTHRLRTDVSALHAVADGLARGAFTPEERAELPHALAAAGAAGQARLTLAQRTGTALRTADSGSDLVAVLEEALGAAGPSVDTGALAGERPLVLLAEDAVRACAEQLAAAIVEDARLAAATVGVHPDPSGWAVVVDGAGATPDDAGAPDGRPAVDPADGPLAAAGWIAGAAGGSSSAAEHRGMLRVNLVLPAAA